MLRSPLLLLLGLGLLGLGLAAPAAPAAPAGTLDQLVLDLESRLDAVLLRRSSRERPLSRQDLALCLRAGAGIGERLAQAVRRLIKGRLVEKSLRSFADLEPAARSALEQRARREGYELLLDLELSLSEGQLNLQGDLVATDRSLWRDLRQPDRGALSHLHASVRVDAEVRAFQGSLSSSSSRFSHQTYPLGRLEVLALATGDVDGDGRAELLVLTQRTVEAYRLRTAGFVKLLQHSLSGPAAALRPRRTMGTLLAQDLDRDKRAEVLARSSDLEKAVELGFDGKALVVRRELDGYPLLVEDTSPSPSLLLGAALPGQDVLGASTLLRQPAAAAGEWQQGLAAALYAVRAARVPGPRARRFVAALDVAGQLALFAPEARTPLLSLPRVGIALDLCDLDDDGRLEIITTGGEGPDVEDQIIVQRLAQPAAGPAQLRPLWRSPGLGGQVAALAHGDLDGNGRLELIAAVRQKGLLQLMVIQ